MKFPQSSLVAVLVLCGAVGCRNPQGFEKMETELRGQEDRIWLLEDYCRQYHDQLESCRNENIALRAKLGTDGKPLKSVRVAPFEESGPRGPKIPDVEVPVPQIEIPDAPTPSSPPSNSVPRKAAASGVMIRRPRRIVSEQPGPAVAAAPRDVAEPESVAKAAAARDNREQADNIRLSSYEAPDVQDAAVTRITFNKLLTAGMNRDGKPGDEGLLVVLEPRNRANELIPPTGELSISVMDPVATTEAAARIGRWNFGAAETARLYRRSALGDGIELSLVWPSRPPVHRRVVVYARLTTADGHKLLARRSLVISPPPAPPAAPKSPAPAPSLARDERLVPEPAEATTEAEAAPTETAPTDTGPTEAAPDLFQVEAVEAGDPAADQPTPAERNRTAAAEVPPPLPVAPATTMPRPSQSVVSHAEPAPVSVLTAGATNIRAAQPASIPLRPIPQAPPADEQVTVPDEPGSAPREDRTLAAQNASAPATPKWAPFR